MRLWCRVPRSKARCSINTGAIPAKQWWPPLALPARSAVVLCILPATRAELICTGEDAWFIGEMDGSMIPIVLVDDRVFGEQGSFLVDYYHRSEYFADAAEECASPKKEARVEWRHTQQDRMKSGDGDIDAVLTGLDQHRNGKKGKAANKSEACHRYIRNRPGQFDYAAAKAARLPDKTGQPSLIPVTWNFTGLIRSTVILLSSPDDSPTENRKAPNKPCSHLASQ